MRKKGLQKSKLLKSSCIALCLCILGLKSTNVFAQDVIDSQSDRIIVTTDIDSTVDEAWRVIIDFKSYTNWNKWYRVEGEPKEGVTVKAFDESGNCLDLKITKIEDNTLCWTDVSWFTHFGLGGWRCRTVALNPKGRGIKFTNHFEYSGPFRSILKYATRKALIEGMVQENQNLKAFIEKENIEANSR